MLFGLGSLVGFLAGLIGIGGGAVSNALLVLLFARLVPDRAIAVQHAFGTNLVVVLGTALAGAVAYARRGNVIWRAAVPLGLGAALGALGGASLAAVLPGTVLRYAFGALLLVSAVRIFFALPAHDACPVPERLWYLLPIGLGVGFVAALTGIGGAVLSIPILILVCRIPVKQIAGTSLAAIPLAVLVALGGYVYFGWHKPGLLPGSLGYANLVYALPVLVTSLIFVNVGAWLNRRLHSRVLQLVVAAVLGLVALRVLAPW